MRKHRPRTLHTAIIAICIAALCMGASACGEEDKKVATPNAFCAFIYNDGEDGRDARLVERVLPAQAVDYDQSKQEAQFIPCGSRNYRVVDGERRGKADRSTPSFGRTNTNTQVKAEWTAYWTTNQDEAASRDFAGLCEKYNCFSSLAEAGDENFATPGWNGLLRENFGPSGDDAFALALEEFDDRIWQTPTRAEYDRLAAAMSRVFNDQASKRTGYKNDVFCGSGSASGWNRGRYTCANVRFVISSVENVDADEQKQVNVRAAADRNKESNRAQLIAAKEKYGDSLAGYFLGIQDSIARCRESRVACTIVIGDKSLGDN